MTVRKQPALAKKVAVIRMAADAVLNKNSISGTLPSHA